MAAAANTSADAVGPFDLDAAQVQNGQKTQAANTPIVLCIPPTKGKFTRLWGLGYRPQGTDHNLFYMVPIGTMQAPVRDDAAAGATTITVETPITDASGNAVANTDYLVIKYADGTCDVVLSGGASGLAITVPALSKQVLSGSNVWMMGTPNTTDHALRSVIARASERCLLIGSKAGIVTTPQKNQPIVLYSSNGTAAGNFDLIEASPVMIRGR
jgi:hypothetical protein